MNTAQSLAVGIGIVIAALVGCRHTAMPNIAHPGDAASQQKQAVRYDPYPEPGVAPNVDGSRPREYQTPISEPASGRWYLDPKTNTERWLDTKVSVKE